MHHAELSGGAEQVAGAADVDTFEEGRLDDHGIGAGDVEDYARAGEVHDAGHVGGGRDVGGVIGDGGRREPVARGIDVQHVDLTVGLRFEKVLDEVEADEAAAASDEGGAKGWGWHWVCHDEE